MLPALTIRAAAPLVSSPSAFDRSRDARGQVAERRVDRVAQLLHSGRAPSSPSSASTAASTLAAASLTAAMRASSAERPRRRRPSAQRRRAPTPGRRAAHRPVDHPDADPLLRAERDLRVLHLQVGPPDDANGDDEDQPDQGELVGEAEAGEEPQGGREDVAHGRFIGRSPGYLRRPSKSRRRRRRSRRRGPRSRTCTRTVVKPSARKPAAWSARARCSAAVLPCRAAAAPMPRRRVLKLRAGEVGRAAEVVGEVGRAHQQGVDLVERGDLLDGLERARPLDLHDAADALVGARAEVGARRAEAVAARERRDPAPAPA